MTDQIREREGLAHAYGLLARLILRGPEPDTVTRLAEVQPMDTPEDLDELRAEHYRAFHLEAFPQAGVFLSQDARAGASSDDVARLHGRVGFHPRLDDVTEDHLGVQLAFLSFATAAHAEAEADGDPRSQILASTLESYLDELVLRWWPALVVALRGADVPYWTGVVELALGLAAHHRRLHGPVPAAPALPEPEAILDDPRTGLRRIAGYMVTPVDAGALLTRTALTRLGREHRVPRGFGGRQLMLGNLLQGAVDLGEIEPVTRALGGWIQTQERAFAALAHDLDLAVALEPWRQRLRETALLVDRMVSAAAMAGELESTELDRASTATGAEP